MISQLKILSCLMSARVAWASIGYQEAFANLQSSVVWPAPLSNAHNISSTFGPRRRVSCSGCYDFHRGIDIHGEVGDDVVATYGGKVVLKTYYSDGGNTIAIQHSFPGDSVLLDPSKGATTKWYTLYMHMSEFLVNVNDIVTAGQLIGKVGQTGSATAPHVHHEVRIGTRCSLEYALQNPSSTCNRMNYDPHIHPMLVYNSNMVGTTSLSLTVVQDMQFGISLDGQLLLQTPDNAANINKYRVTIQDSNNQILKEQVLDLNLRTGYDATSNAALDTKDVLKPYLEPISFGYTSSDWQMTLVIPYTWANAVAGIIHVDIYDTWGELAAQEILRN